MDSGCRCTTQQFSHGSSQSKRNQAHKAHDDKTHDDLIHQKKIKLPRTRKAYLKSRKAKSKSREQRLFVKILSKYYKVSLSSLFIHLLETSDTSGNFCNLDLF